MYNFIMSQIDYTGTALTQAQLETIVVFSCVFLVVVTSVAAVSLLFMVIRRISGGIK